MIRVGVAGASGYTAGELLRLLPLHPEVDVAWCYSHSRAGERAGDTHDGLGALHELRFTDAPSPEVDAVFLCLGHGHSGAWLERYLPGLPAGVRVVDLSADFRRGAAAAPSGETWPEAHGRRWVYGLTEAHADEVRAADAVANPGCFATALQLGLLPLASAGLLVESPVSAHAITGATGAGRGLSATTHFSWRVDNVSVYKPFRHQHLGEVRATLTQASGPGSALAPLHFVPMRGPFARGIFASLHVACAQSAEELRALYAEVYADEPFARVFESPIHLKEVVNTNRVALHVDAFDGQAHVTVALDNLLKGAVGQAVENLNLLFGLPRATGLQLKGSAF